MAMLNSTKPVLVGLALLLFVAAAACSSGDNGGTETGAPAAAAGDTEAAPAAGSETGYELAQQFELSITVTSTKFNETRRIPRKYSCTEEDVSPPITWGDVPDGTVSLALMVDSDQHPGSLWGHWVLWGIPADARGLPEEIPNGHDAPAIGPKAAQGTNDDNKIGWSGPCPGTLKLSFQPGHGGGPIKAANSYYFRLYALDVDLDLGAEATKWDFLRAIDGHVLAGGELLGEQVSSKQDNTSYP